MMVTFYAGMLLCILKLFRPASPAKALAASRSQMLSGPLKRDCELAYFECETLNHFLNVLAVMKGDPYHIPLRNERHHQW